MKPWIIAGLAVLSFSFAGCAVYEDPYGYGYGYAPAPYASYRYVAPPVVYGGTLYAPSVYPAYRAPYAYPGWRGYGYYGGGYRVLPRYGYYGGGYRGWSGYSHNWRSGGGHGHHGGSDGHHSSRHSGRH